MPSNTFFHLPKEKQDTLVHAARKEFSRVPFTDASINRIIKDAEISRGSFYMYFAGKEDLYSYLLVTYRDAVLSAMIEYLKKYQGDMIEAVRETFCFLLDTYYQEEMPFFKMVIHNFSFSPDYYFFSKPSASEKQKMLEKLQLLFDDKKLNLENGVTVWDIFHLTKLVTIHTLMLLMKEQLTVEEAKVYHRRLLLLLSQGISHK